VLWLFYNDVDFCRRLRAAGHQIAYVAEARVLHHEGRSTAQFPEFGAIWHKNRLSYYRKAFGWRGTAVARVMTLVRGVEEVRKLKRARAPREARRACGARCARCGRCDFRHAEKRVARPRQVEPRKACGTLDRRRGPTKDDPDRSSDLGSFWPSRIERAAATQPGRLAAAAAAHERIQGPPLRARRRGRHPRPLQPHLLRGQPGLRAAHASRSGGSSSRRTPAGMQIMVAVDGQGKLIANYSSTPAFCSVRGEQRLCTQIVDSCVDKDWRRSLRKGSVFVTIGADFLRFFSTAGRLPFDDFIYGLPNEKAFPIGTRVLGYKPVHVPLYALVHHVGAETGGWLGALGERAGNVTVEELRGDDWSEVARLFLAHKDEIQLGLWRDEAYLAWRYAPRPARALPHAARAARRPPRRARSCVRMGWFGHRVLPLVDWIGPGADVEAVAALLQGAGPHRRRLRARAGSRPGSRRTRCTTARSPSSACGPSPRSSTSASWSSRPTSTRVGQGELVLHDGGQRHLLSRARRPPCAWRGPPYRAAPDSRAAGDAVRNGAIESPTLAWARRLARAARAAASLVAPARAQQTQQAAPRAPAAAPSDEPPAFTPEQLEQMLAPIALYPDDLLSPDPHGHAPTRSRSCRPTAGSRRTGHAADEAASSSRRGLGPEREVARRGARRPGAAQRQARLDAGARRRLHRAAGGGARDGGAGAARGAPRRAGKLESYEDQNGRRQARGSTQTIVIESAQPDVIYVPVYDTTVVYGYWPYPAIRRTRTTRRPSASAPRSRSASRGATPGATATGTAATSTSTSTAT
jgi:hypothetical protein